MLTGLCVPGGFAAGGGNAALVQVREGYLGRLGMFRVFVLDGGSIEIPFPCLHHLLSTCSCLVFGLRFVHVVITRPMFLFPAQAAQRRGNYSSFQYLLRHAPAFQINNYYFSCLSISCCLT